MGYPHKLNHHLQGRIRYVENYLDDGEHFVFENKWSDEPDTEWGLDTAYKLHDLKSNIDNSVLEKGCLINCQALTKLREWQRLGVEYWFSK